MMFNNNYHSLIPIQTNGDNLKKMEINIEF